MSRYRAFVAGSNFPGDAIGKRGKVGFFTTVVVRAESLDDVQAKVASMLRLDPRIVWPEGVQEGDEPLIEVEEVEELPDNMMEIATEGLVWYADEDEPN